MTTNLKIFAFSGNGNYSDVAGWDNGLTCHISKEVSWEDAYETDNYHDEENISSLSGNILPDPASSGVYVYFHDENGGSRNVDGWVVAESKEEAEELLKNYSEKFPVVEYEQ